MKKRLFPLLLSLALVLALLPLPARADGNTRITCGVLTEPGCTTEGLRRGDCIRCDSVREEVIAPLGHDLSSVVTEPTCTEGGFTTHTCARCGGWFTDDPTDPLGHDWSGTVCRRCGEHRDNPFTDVPEGSFYHAPVIQAVERGITNGLSPTAFGPNAICNRAQIVTFLYWAFA